MDEEDELIEQQLREAQARIAQLKAQVAKERKMRLKLKKKGASPASKPDDGMRPSASAPALGKAPVVDNDEEKQRQNIRAAISSAEKIASSKSDDAGSKRGGPATTVGVSASQPALNRAPDVVSTPKSRPSTSTGSKRRRKKKHGGGGARPKTASPGSSRRTLSPVKFRPSKKHVEQAQNMSLKRLKELLSDGH